MQKIFCTLHAIYVETNPDLFIQAYGDAYEPAPGKIAGSILGFHQRVLQKPTTLAQEMATIDANPFGRPAQPDTLGSFTGPEISGVNLGLYSVLTHELSHILDSFNQVNVFGKGCLHSSLPEDQSYKCTAKPGTWAALSWISQKESVFDNRVFPDRNKFEAYFRPEGPFIPIEEAERLFEKLNQTSFLTTLGSAQPIDVFFVLGPDNVFAVVRSREGAPAFSQKNFDYLLK